MNTAADRRLVPLHLIDEPDPPMRSDIDDEQLNDLAARIQRQGLIHPVALRATGERYRIIAGHRRYLATKMLGKHEIDSKIYTDSAISDEEIKFSENFGREDVSDADTAIWLAELQQKHHYTLEKLQEITRQSEDWISKRLRLFEGDENIFIALRNKQIKLGHAIELNKFPEQFRQQYLQQVITSTPPVRIVEQWRKDLELMNMPQQTEQAEQQPAAEGTPMPGVVVEACEVCQGNTLPWTMKFVRVHAHCFDMIVKAIQHQG